MCGIAGLWELQPSFGAERSIAVATAMAASIRHRGPDASGVWVDAIRGVALAHTRLSIVDLSDSGRQPMTSPSGRFRIVFNGEIYNYLELKRELSATGAAFRSTSDTEVLLHCIERFGLSATLRRTNGMFAFALWDERDGRLHFARDRVGKKPLYLGEAAGTVVFASELKALRKVPGFDASIDPDAVAELLRIGYIAAPRSIYAKVRKIAAGTILTIERGAAGNFVHKVERYWSVCESYEHGQKTPFCGTLNDAVAELRGLLADSVRIRMIADVPVGAFLSGGIDSSTVVALMQTQSHRPVKTFTIGFEEDAYNEAGYAERVARHIGTEHTGLYVTARDALGVIDTLATVYDEPFADSSQIPAVLLARLTGRQVKVVISGDGGDEFFYGYSRYERFRRAWRLLHWLPPGLRSVAAGCVQGMSGPAVSRLLRRFDGPVFADAGSVCLSQQLEKVAALLRARNSASGYETMLSHWMDMTRIVQGPVNADGASDGRQYARRTLPDHMMVSDACRYLPDDILVKVDRATMAASLEARAPLLDYRVIDLAFSLPHVYKCSGGVGKRVLRGVLHELVPDDLVNRPKAGFGVPLGRWLRSELREWAEDLLTKSSLDELPFLRSQPIRERWAQHLSGRCDWSDSLWDVLMLQSWRGSGCGAAP